MKDRKEREGERGKPERKEITANWVRSMPKIKRQGKKKG